MPGGLYFQVNPTTHDEISPTRSERVADIFQTRRQQLVATRPKCWWHCTGLWPTVSVADRPELLPTLSSAPESVEILLTTREVSGIGMKVSATSLQVSAKFQKVSATFPKALSDRPARAARTSECASDFRDYHRQIPNMSPILATHPQISPTPPSKVSTGSAIRPHVSTVRLILAFTLFSGQLHVYIFVLVQQESTRGG